MKRIAVLIAAAFLWPAFAHAEGVTDFVISPGATYTISAAGHYRLAQNVNMTSDVPAVSISASDVTLDLNGHIITGPAVSTAIGIFTQAFIAAPTIMNGSVRGFGSWGISVGQRATVTNCKATNNNKNGTAGGISVGFHSVVTDCIVTANNSTTGSTIGINADFSSRIIGNTVDDNDSPDAAAIGINATNVCIISDNTVANQTTTGGTFSPAIGINAGARCVIRGNAVDNNDSNGTGSSSNATGIVTTAGCIIDSNTCSDQTSGNSTGNSSGISTTSSTITNNDCLNNSPLATGAGEARGIYAGSNSTLRGNRCEGNNVDSPAFAVGILVDARCLIEDNNLIRNVNTSGPLSWGIRATQSGNVITGNRSEGHTKGAIVLLQGTNTRVQLNLWDEPTGIDNVAGQLPSSLGAGDLANVVY